MSAEAFQPFAARPRKCVFLHEPGATFVTHGLQGRIERGERAAARFIGAHGAGLRVADQDDGPRTQRPIDDLAAREIAQSPGFFLAVRAQREDLFLRPEPVVRHERREHEVGAREIATVGAARPVIAYVAGVERQNLGIGVAVAPLPPARDRHGKDLKLDAGPGEWANHRPAKELVPQGIGLLVIHQLVRAVEKTGGAEDKRGLAPVNAGVIQNARPTQGAVGEGHRHTADDVVEHLVPVHDAQRVGTRITVDGDTEHLFVVGQVFGVPGVDQLGVDQRRDTVLDDAAPSDLLNADVVRNAAAEKEAEVRVDDGIEVGLEGIEPLEGHDLRVRLLPQNPFVPFGAGLIARQGL